MSDKPDNEFEELIKPFYPRIYRWALVLTGAVDDADDVTQEAVIRAYRHFGSFRGDSSVSTWLYRITRNAALEMMNRSEKRKKLQVRDAAEELIPSVPPGQAGIDADRGELLRIVRSFFEELSGRQRELFDLVDLQGHEPAEAADMLGIDAATARTHLLRARRAIRSRILQRYPELMEGIV